jgi:hypothetical protein
MREPRRVYYDASTKDYLEMDCKPAFTRDCGNGKFADAYTGDPVTVEPMPEHLKRKMPEIKPQPYVPSAWQEYADKFAAQQRMPPRNKLSVPVKEVKRPQHEFFCTYPLSCCCKAGQGR